MSEVKLFWTLQGQVLGNIDKVGSDQYRVEEPVLVIPGGQGIQLLPILGFAQEKFLQIRKTDVLYNGELFEPIVELRNAYTEQFGSGIQLLSR